MSEEYGPAVTLERLRREIEADDLGFRFHPAVRLKLQTFVLLTSNANIDFICELIKIAGENHEIQGQDS